MRSRLFTILVAPLLALALLGAGGCGPAGSTAAGSSPAPVADPFTDVTDAAGIRWVNQPAKRPMRLLESVGYGGGFLDFDGDGHLDILLVGAPRCGLFRNRGDGTFTDVSASAGIDKPGEWIGCAVSDYDNDGDADFFLSGYRTGALFRNAGDGTFKDVTAQSGLKLPPKWWTAVTFADFDRDGHADLYVGAYCVFGPDSLQYCVLHQNGVKTSCRPIDYEADKGHCFRNRGDGTFEDVTRRWGLEKTQGKTLGAVVADYDADGWPDLYLANDELPADLFRNMKGKGFQNVAVETGTAFSEGGDLMGGMGVDWGDYDNDGWLDLVVGTFESEKKPLFRSLEGKSFEFASGTAGILPATYPDVVFGSLLFDYDNDGWLDLLFVNGHTADNIQQIRPTMQYRQPARLFRNLGQGRFELAASPSLSVPIAGRAVACGDVYNRGMLDLLVVDMDGKVRLLKNAGKPQHHWLEIAVEGRKSHRDALGARVELTVAGQRRVAEVVSARSYLSACDPRVHFGLGSASRVERLEVHWPSGETTVRSDVAVDQLVRITEGE